MYLQELLKGIQVEKIIGNMDIDIEDIYFDSRFVTEKSLFICIEGFKTTGSLYINEAIQRGAVAILSEKEIAIEGTTTIKVENSRKALAAVASRFYNFPTNTLKLVGITGTNGKTSITYMVKSILGYYNINVGLIGTISNWIGNKEIEAVRTTPESLELQKILNEMVEQKVDTCVMEVSSHALELGRVDHTRFTMGIFTNLTPEHLDFHEDMDHYRNAKKKLFYKTTLCNIINVDDIHGKMIAEELKEEQTPLITFGMNQQADVYATDLKINLKGVSFQLHMGQDSKEFHVKIPGLFTVYNAMPSILICYILGLSLEEISIALEAMKGVPGRFEVVEEIQRNSVIIDYAHTPDALENILISARKFAPKRIITVFGCGGDRDKTKRRIMGEISGKYSDYSIITSDNPRTEEPLKIIEMIEDGIKQVTDQYKIMIDRRCAIEYAMKIAEEKDIIILAGKGHEKTQVIGNEVFYFDDREVALEIARKEGLI